MGFLIQCLLLQNILMENFFKYTLVFIPMVYGVLLETLRYLFGNHLGTTQFSNAPVSIDSTDNDDDD